MINLPILHICDDGAMAVGAKQLRSILSDYGKDFFSISPTEDLSGVGGQISTFKIVQSKLKNLSHSTYSYSGTPIDCARVYLDKYKTIPKICVSGINNGNNFSKDIMHSGTVQTAMYVASRGGLGISISNSINSSLDELNCKYLTKLIINLIKRYSEKEMEGICISINLPQKLNEEKIIIVNSDNDERQKVLQSYITLRFLSTNFSVSSNKLELYSNTFFSEKYFDNRS